MPTREVEAFLHREALMQENPSDLANALVVMARRHKDSADFFAAESKGLRAALYQTYLYMLKIQRVLPRDEETATLIRKIGPLLSHEALVADGILPADGDYTEHA